MSTNLHAAAPDTKNQILEKSKTAHKVTVKDKYRHNTHPYQVTSILGYRISPNSFIGCRICNEKLHEIYYYVLQC